MRRQSYFWVFVVVFQAFKNYFVPNTIPKKEFGFMYLKSMVLLYTLFKQTRFLSMLAKFTW